MREEIWGREVAPLRAPGSKHPVRISDQEEKRLGEFRDWYWGEEDKRRLKEGAPVTTIYTGVPNYSGWRKGQADPNGYLKQRTYDGSKPGIALYRCGGSMVGHH